jgi:signal transduction histidine kinase/CheY-like chemotaxis protein
MSEIMQKKINKKWKVVAGVASFIIAFFGFVAISGFIFEFNHMLYKERAYHFNETASQITATVDIAIDEQWSLLQIMSVRFSAFDEYTTEECISKITVMENKLGKDGLLFGIIDKDGNIFATNEDEKVYTLDGLKLDENQEKTLAILSPVEDSDAEYMTFIMKNEMPVTLGDGRVITHTVVFWEMDYYKKIFHNDAYGEENSIFIRGNDGVNIYTESQKYNFLKGFNYMDVYPEVELVKGNTIKEIEENIKNNKSSVTSIKVLSENKKYFITVQPMRNNDWDLVMVVPQEFISAETIDIASAMVNTATFIAILICFGILMLVVYIYKSRSNSLLLKQEREYSKALAASAEEAQNANMAKTKFLSHMSHDIRTPINGILGMISKAERHIAEPEVVKDCHKKIRMSAEHLLGLINDILDITKLETGLNEEKDEPFPMSCMLDTCCSIIKGQLSEKGTVEFKTDFSNIQHDSVLGNKLHIRQILLNILSNAVKYTDNGYIYFKAEEVAFNNDEATYAFTIQDTGIGMHKSYIEKIFEPFSIDDSEDRKYRLGTGLGMSIVKNNVDRLGGTISIDSTLGLGSTFTVTFTLKLTDLDVVCEAVKERVNKNSADVSGMKVLLVEDNELNIEVALMLLEDAGVSADVAKNGKEAVDKFLASKEGDYDLILMDVMMPVMNGYEATQIIRSSTHPLATTIPIIAQTANAFQDDIKKTKEVGMDAHISKPIEEENLLKILAQFKK